MSSLALIRLHLTSYGGRFKKLAMSPLPPEAVITANTRPHPLAGHTEIGLWVYLLVIPEFRVSGISGTQSLAFGVLGALVSLHSLGMTGWWEGCPFPI